MNGYSPLHCPLDGKEKEWSPGHGKESVDSSHEGSIPKIPGMRAREKARDGFLKAQPGSEGL